LSIGSGGGLFPEGKNARTSEGPVKVGRPGPHVPVKRQRRLAKKGTNKPPPPSEADSGPGRKGASCCPGRNGGGPATKRGNGARLVRSLPAGAGENPHR